MELDTNAVLITGGGSGIGLALAERFIRAGSRVMICGRREERLKQVQSKYPQIQIRVCDVADPAARKDLFDWAVRTDPKLNVLVNNAGIQNRIDLPEQPAWEAVKAELAINLEAPMHLSTLFIPHLVKQARPAIINVTSGLAFVPLANVPVYCATKAAMHSFTLSLRHQLRDTPICVREIIPPAVNTDLGGKGLHTFGVPLDEFADAIMDQLKTGATEASYGFSTQMRQAGGQELEAAFRRLNPSGQ